MEADKPIVRPHVGRKTPRLGRLAVMAAAGPDVEALRPLLCGEPCSEQTLYHSRLCRPPEDPPPVALAGPFIGAPYAVMVLETLIAWGAREILFAGWCGAVDPQLAVGDLLVVSAAIVDEGTSPHYGGWPGLAVSPAAGLTDRICDGGRACGIGFHTGRVWCTDAIFRETPRKVAYFRDRGARAVEMETSALFTVGAYQGAAVGAVLLVSDLLTESGWVPGFRDERFLAGRRALHRMVEAVCQKFPNRK